MFENGALCAEIAETIGLSKSTVEGGASLWGWVRKAQVCCHCGAPVPIKSNRGNRRSCDACRLARQRRHRARLTPEQRQEERRREAARKGRAYLTREERAKRQQGESARRQRPAVQLGRYRHYGEPPITADGARLILQALLRKLLVTKCAEEGVKPDTVEYRAKYRSDPAFRAKEKAKSAGQKKARGVLVSPDGSITTEVMRRLFATASMCPYCDRLMTSRQKTLDHMEPISRGGQHTLGNVTVCCHSCNSRKRAMPFAQWIGRLPAHIAARFARGRAA